MDGGGRAGAAKQLWNGRRLSKGNSPCGRAKAAWRFASRRSPKCAKPNLPLDFFITVLHYPLYMDLALAW